MDMWIAVKRFTLRTMVILLTGTTSACATDLNVGGPLPIDKPTPVAVLPPPPPPANATQQADALTFEVMPDGETLAVQQWVPDTKKSPRAVILALHGYGDHAVSTFHEAASYWQKQGVLTVAYDQRGFGHNPTFGRWPGPAQLVQDMQVMIERTRQQFPDQPLYLMGHSMGGGVILAGAVQELNVDGVILLAPAAWGGDFMPVFQRALAWSATWAVPDKRFNGKGIVGIQASDNIPMLTALGQDPYYLKPPSPRELLGLIRLMDMAYVGTSALMVPTLFIYGEKDQIALPDMMAQVYQRIPAGQKSIKVYTDGWHMLLRDLQAPKVWKDITSWIN